MKYSRVFIDAIGYELPPVVVTSQELEARLRPVYQALRLQEGQLEPLTGIAERRWWERSMELFKSTLAALTGGSGAVAVLLTDGSFHPDGRRRLLGGTTQAAPRHYGLCRWGLTAATAPLHGLISYARQIACTDSVGIL